MWSLERCLKSSMKSTPFEDEARQLGALLRSEPETWTADCVPSEQIILLAEQSVPEAQAAPQMAHIALCSRCRREFAETLELLHLAEEVRALEAPPASVPVSPTPLPTPNLPINCSFLTSSQPGSGRSGRAPAR